MFGVPRVCPHSWKQDRNHLHLHHCSYVCRDTCCCKSRGKGQNNIFMKPLYTLSKCILKTVAAGSVNQSRTGSTSVWLQCWLTNRTDIWHMYAYFTNPNVRIYFLSNPGRTLQTVPTTTTLHHEIPNAQKPIWGTQAHNWTADSLRSSHELYLYVKACNSLITSKLATH